MVSSALAISLESWQRDCELSGNNGDRFKVCERKKHETRDMRSETRTYRPMDRSMSLLIVRFVSFMASGAGQLDGSRTGNWHASFPRTRNELASAFHVAVWVRESGG